MKLLTIPSRMQRTSKQSCWRRKGRILGVCAHEPARWRSIPAQEKREGAEQQRHHQYGNLAREDHIVLNYRIFTNASPWWMKLGAWDPAAGGFFRSSWRVVQDSESTSLAIQVGFRRVLLRLSKQSCFKPTSMRGWELTCLGSASNLTYGSGPKSMVPFWGRCTTHFLF